MSASGGGGTRTPVQTPLWTAPARLVLAAGLLLGLRARYRFEVSGRLPARRGPTLIVANHQHDLESVVVPALALLMGPRRDPVFAVASQRLFEQGFLTARAPGWLRPVVRDWSLAGLLWTVGALPIENEPRSRALASLAQEVARRHGDLPAADVFAPEALEALGDGARRAPQRPRLRDLWGPDLASAAGRRVSSLLLREPYRTEVRARTRPRLEAQLARIEGVVRRGATVYLTPEGRVTPDGRLGRFHIALERLLRAAGESVYLACVNYDPFARRRLTLRCRLVRLRAPQTLREELCAGRVVGVSQLLAAWLREVRPGDAFAPDDALRGVEVGLAGLPDGACLAPGLASVRGTTAAVRGALRTMARLGYLSRRGAGYAPTGRRRDARLHEPADVFAHQRAVLDETCAALTRLRAPDR